MSHTPGPWRPSGDIEANVIAGPNGEVVVRPAHPIHEADRALIAAAPDLLEALERIAARPYNGLEQAIDIARAAIDKATKEES